MERLLLGCDHSISILIPPYFKPIPIRTSSSSSSPRLPFSIFTTHRTIILIAVVSYLHIFPNSQTLSAEIAEQQLLIDDTQLEEDRVVTLFEEKSPSTVFIKDLEIVDNPKTTDEVVMLDDKKEKIEGKGSGFIWDKFGHIVFLVDKSGNGLSRDGKTVGVDASCDLAVIKVDVKGIEVKPVEIGSASKLNVGQS